jgi:hypothetical protein
MTLYTQPANQPLNFGEEVSLSAPYKCRQPDHPRPYTIAEAVVSDGSGSLLVTWTGSPGYQAAARRGPYRPGWKDDQYLGRLVMNNPDGGWNSSS